MAVFHLEFLPGRDLSCVAKLNPSKGEKKKVTRTCCSNEDAPFWETPPVSQNQSKLRHLSYDIMY